MNDLKSSRKLKITRQKEPKENDKNVKLQSTKAYSYDLR